MSSGELPPGLKTFGPSANCTLDICPAEWSIYGYQPSLGANATFLVMFAILGLVHTYLGVRWRSWGFMSGMIVGCLCEIIGYAGRIILFNNPFSFGGFMVQIITLAIAPVFYTAAIYVTLSKAIVFFAPDLSRFKPQLFIWIFIPFDVVCLILQAVGGAMSTRSGGQDQAGVNISMAGLALQVIILTAFVACFGDYMFRYWRSGRYVGFGWRIKGFFLGLTSSILLILARCAYRVAELRDGYHGELIKEEVPFVILEGVLIVLACLALCFGHPGLVFGQSAPPKGSDDGESGTATPERK
ncbi:RTA1 like protein [Hirsutella rhossiliensis]|uniref:RTA1 like protein n=1 Tax=Hirsutella rhossiliensis TaxID=111463 RepID=A0A9P8SM99_9HYPO|nr:RTA1 like protein [Hirsutella rhossiliensis]KAH0965946.1 RTA1 like protein [Hirsutella rhossiliensis]